MKGGFPITKILGLILGAEDTGNRRRILKGDQGRSEGYVVDWVKFLLIVLLSRGS